MGLKLAPGDFLGEVRFRRHVAGLTLEESIYGPDLRLPRHAHECAFFYLVLEGSSTEIYGTRVRAAERSHLVFHPAGETHANHWHDAGGRCFHIEIAPALLELFPDHAPLDQPAEFRGGLPITLAFRLYGESTRSDTAAPLAIAGLALELLAEASRAPDRAAADASRQARPPLWLREARELLQEQFHQPPELAEIADAVGVHPAHLARAFRRRYHCSVGDYVRRLRVEFACRELATSERALSEIALAAGFADQSHFTKTFRRLLGLTPGEFRRRSGREV
jgi:AraC family transcriptional regulator